MVSFSLRQRIFYPQLQDPSPVSFHLSQFVSRFHWSFAPFRRSPHNRDLTSCFLRVSGFSTLFRGAAAVVQSRLNRGKKGLFAKRLEETSHRAINHHPGERRLISMGRDENDRDRTGIRDQSPLEFRSTHAPQSDIKDQALRFVELLRIEKVFSRFKRLDLETHRLQQALQRLADGFVVVNYRDQGNPIHGEHVREHLR